MPTGEFEYIKPPQFYADDVEVKEDFLPHLTDKREQARASNPLISGKRPRISEDIPVVNNPEGEEPQPVDASEEVTEIEITVDDANTSTHKIIVKRLNKPIRGRIPILCGKEQEIIAKYNEGMILEELAHLYNVSTPCISRAITRGGGVVRKRGRRKR